MGDGIQIFEQAPEVQTVTYRLHQELEVVVAPNEEAYVARVLFDEVMNDGDITPRERVAQIIDLDEIPEEQKEAVQKVIIEYLKKEGIEVNEETKID